MNFQHCKHYELSTLQTFNFMNFLTLRTLQTFNFINFQHYELTYYSHSIVAGGLLLMSYATRLMPFTSLMMRVDTKSRKS